MIINRISLNDKTPEIGDKVAVFDTSMEGDHTIGNITNIFKNGNVTVKCHVRNSWTGYWEWMHLRVTAAEVFYIPKQFQNGNHHDFVQKALNLYLAHGGC